MSYVCEGNYKYEIIFLIEAKEYVKIKVKGEDLTPEQAKEIAKEKLNEKMKIKYPNYKVQSLIQTVGEKYEK